jgi:hypothetical protein
MSKGRILTWIVGVVFCVIFTLFMVLFFSVNITSSEPDAGPPRVEWILPAPWLIFVCSLGCCGILGATYFSDKYSKRSKKR